MDISSISEIGQLYGLMPQKAPTISEEVVTPAPEDESARDFSSVFKAAMDMVDETNTLQNEAANEAIKFELGLSDNAHDLIIAEQKAEVALQYTVAVRDNIIEAYRTIMQMQI